MAAPIPRDPPVTRATRSSDEWVFIIHFDELQKPAGFLLDNIVHNWPKNISDQTVKAFNAVAAIARKTSGLAPALAVSFIPTIVD
jgi:hypothetical protein